MVLSGIILFLAPKKENRMLQFAVRIFFLLSVALPLAGARLPDLSIPETEVSDLGGDLSELAQRQLEAAVVSSLEAEAEEILAGYGLPEAEAEISIHNDPSDGISITGLVIRVPPEGMDAAARAAVELNRTFGVTARLETEDETDGED